MYYNKEIISKAPNHGLMVWILNSQRLPVGFTCTIYVKFIEFVCLCIWLKFGSLSLVGCSCENDYMYEDLSLRCELAFWVLFRLLCSYCGVFSLFSFLFFFSFYFFSLLCFCSSAWLPLIWNILSFCWFSAGKLGCMPKQRILLEITYLLFLLRYLIKFISNPHSNHEYS